ncbi:MAG: hypothetical protein ACI9BW_002845 [Gammaproteobacteria bacterium]|jgi:hypothetical protein
MKHALGGRPDEDHHGDYQNGGPNLHPIHDLFSQKKGRPLCKQVGRDSNSFRLVVAAESAEKVQ